ncbi:MAG: oligosaccharide flippase family protein [Goleter apudmare HA4340-LM2]|jgi:O-antigen/teichoic acid export membrane protein|nr:oligosaccharide flippase family protein [Goleter apudmare HA4340-LM2]
MTSIKKLAIRGAVWTIVGYGTSQILRFGCNLILTRLLIPEFFGIMAIVNTLQVGLELFSDLGIGQSIIRNKRGDDPVFLNTAWTLQVIRGFFIWMICLLITWPATQFYGDPRFFWLIPIVGLSSIFGGFSSTSWHTLNRRMELDKATLFELAVQVLSLSLLIFLAWLYPSVLALAVGAVSSSILRMVGTHWLNIKSPNRFAWDQESLGELISFGKWMFLATALMFLAEQVDRLILGKLLSFQMLGVYTIAYTLANLPREVIKHLSYRVIFPTVSSQIELPPASLRDKILPQRRLILFGFAVFLAVLVSIGDLIISTLYDQRYTQATWMMPILCSGVWFSILFYTTSPILLAIDKPIYAAQSNLFRFLMIALGLPIAFTLTGTLGVIIVIALSDLPLYVVNLYGLWREKLLFVAQDMQATLFFIGILASLILIRNFLGFGLPISAIL